MVVKRAKRKVPEMVLTVEWDPGRERYVVFNDLRQVAGLSPGLNMAIGAGMIESGRLRKEGYRVLLKVKDPKNGKLRLEHITEPASDDPGGSEGIRYRRQSRWRRAN